MQTRSQDLLGQVHRTALAPGRGTAPAAGPPLAARPLQVRWNPPSHDVTLKLPHGRCPQCYNHISCQRSQDIAVTLTPDTAVSGYSLDGDRLGVTWSDGHRSVYSAAWLRANTYEGRRASPCNPEQGRLLWNASIVDQLERQLEPVLHERLHEEETVRRVFQNLFRYGFVKVERVPATVEATQGVIERLFRRLSNTVFGDGMWNIGSNYEHKDTGYTSEYLEAHTDTTYFSEAIGNLAFHCIDYDAVGGESFFVDGFYAAERLRRTDPAAYGYLSRTAVESEYVEPGEHFAAWGPFFRHHPVTGRIQQIRYNLYDRAPMTSLAQSEVAEFYVHLRSLASLLRQPENEYVVRLSPGTVMIIDNWRVLHGRRSFRGKRVVVGSYVTRCDYVSQARRHGVDLHAA